MYSTGTSIQVSPSSPLNRANESNQNSITSGMSSRSVLLRLNTQAIFKERTVTFMNYTTKLIQV